MENNNKQAKHEEVCKTIKKMANNNRPLGLIPGKLMITTISAIIIIIIIIINLSASV
jgi:hypothetical protein